jgi:hypothetical protein
MRKELVHLVLLMLCAATALLAQQEQQITVTGGDVNNNVVIVTAQEGETFLELRCYKGTTDCNIPRLGTYAMVRLPKNRGPYDCINVRLYTKMADSQVGQLVGEYCLFEEK